MRIKNSRAPDENGIVGEGLGFERIRRITGYLVGTIDRFNNAKAKEVMDRVRHMPSQEQSCHCSCEIEAGYNPHMR